MKQFISIVLISFFLASCSTDTANFENEAEKVNLNENRFQDIRSVQHKLIGETGQFWVVNRRRSSGDHKQLKFRSVTSKRRPGTLYKGSGFNVWRYHSKVSWYYFAQGSGRSKRSFVKIGNTTYRVAYVSNTSLTLRKGSRVYRFRANQS